MGNLLSKVNRKYSQLSVSWGVQVGFTEGDIELSLTQNFSSFQFSVSTGLILGNDSALFQSRILFVCLLKDLKTT